MKYTPEQLMILNYHNRQIIQLNKEIEQHEQAIKEIQNKVTNFIKELSCK